MNGLTTKKRPTRRGGPAAFVIALLISLAAISTPVQAQEIMSFYAFEGFQGGVSVGAARGQTVRIVFRSTTDFGPLLKPSGDPDVIVAGSGASGAHVKVFNAATGALLWSRDLTSLTPGLHTFDIKRDELPGVGNSDNDRLQVYIEVVIVEREPGRGWAGVYVYPPTFEVIDNLSGMTTVSGGLWKTTNFLTTDPVRSRPIVFTGLE